MEKNEPLNKKNTEIKEKSLKEKVKIVWTGVYHYCTEYQIMDGSLTPQNVSIISYLLGITTGLGVVIAVVSKYGNFGAFIAFLALYHNLEFVSTAAFRRETLSIDSYLLNHSTAYHAAMTIGMLEYWIERMIFKNSSWKGFNIVSIIGLLLVIIGQTIRTLSMFTAKSNFSHMIEEEKRPQHKLVTTGIYSIFRHPAYTGFFYWGIGTQMLLMNPISLIGYAVVLQKFFKDRIRYEEYLLKDFFGNEYEKYKKTTKTYIPGIN